MCTRQLWHDDCHNDDDDDDDDDNDDDRDMTVTITNIKYDTSQ